MRTFLRALVLSATVASAVAAQAEPPKDPEVGLAHLALTNAPAKGNAKLTVTTPAFRHMAALTIGRLFYEKILASVATAWPLWIRKAVGNPMMA